MDVLIAGGAVRRVAGDLSVAVYCRARARAGTAGRRAGGVRLRGVALQPGRMRAG